MELADLVIINKADGDFVSAANIASADVRSALHLMKAKSPDWTVEVLETSALNNTGIDQVWEKINAFRDIMQQSGDFESRREEQAVSAIWTELNELMLNQVQLDNSGEMSDTINAVRENRITPLAAASELFKTINAK